MFDILAADIYPAVFTVLVNGKQWGREGGIGESPDGDCDDVGPALYHIGEG